MATTKMITKSIRLAPNEDRLLKTVAASEFLPESALIRKWILESLLEYRLKKAIDGYKNKEFDLSRAAEIAGVSVRKIMSILEKEKIPILDSKEMFNYSLESLSKDFGLPHPLSK